MRCLVDTNILIYREGPDEVMPGLQALMRIASSNRVTILIHPLSRKEIENDRNPKRRAVEVSKVSTYPVLESPPRIDDDKFLQIIPESKNENEFVDNNLLYAVYKGAIDYLISEDHGIHTKAQNLGLSDKVLTINSAIELLVTLYNTKTPIAPLALRLVPMHNIDLSDTFFESLKNKYSFMSWWKKTATSGRNAWVYYCEDRKIGALLILKEEEEPIASEPSLSKLKRIKICTFMVTEIGRRIGELLLKVAFDYARVKRIDQLYLTHFPDDNDYLVSLITRYGFHKVSVQGEEDVYIKDMVMIKPICKDKISDFYYPSYYDGPDVQKLIVPIQPEYFERLFISKLSKQLSFAETSQLVPEQNTIRKAYICNTSTKVNVNDVILFYRSRDYSSIIILGTVYKVIPNLRDAEKIQTIVGDRTVYSYEELRLLTSRPNPVTVILFRYHFEFEIPVDLDFLINKGVLVAPPMSVTRISDTGYDIVIKRGKIDERYTVH